MENPFYITGIIPEPYFCDREKETSWMVRTLENKAHILLSSPRRMGKTQLIRHVFAQKSIKDNYHTFYTDIYPTTSLNEFVLFLSKEIYSVLVPKGKTVLNRFLAGLHSLAGSFGYDPVSNTPTFTIKLGDASGITDVKEANMITGKSYYTAAGAQLNDMQPGINIVRKRMADGSISTVKIIK